MSYAAGGAAAAFVAGGAVSRSQCDTTGHRQGLDTVIKGVESNPALPTSDAVCWESFPVVHRGLYPKDLEQFLKPSEFNPIPESRRRFQIADLGWAFEHPPPPQELTELTSTGDHATTFPRTRQATESIAWKHDICVYTQVRVL